MPTATDYTLTATTTTPFADAVERVRAELNEEGFGVLCEIDVQATLREKLGVEQGPTRSSAPATRRSPTRRFPPSRNSARCHLPARRADAHLGDRR